MSSGEYRFQQYMVDQLRVSPNQLLEKYEEAIQTDLTTDELDILASEIGLSWPSGVAGELTDFHTIMPPDDAIEPRTLLLGACSLVLGAHVHEGKLSQTQAEQIIEDTVSAPADQSHFMSELYKSRASKEYEEGHKKMAIKLIRKGINHALKTDEAHTIISCRNDEAFYMCANGLYKEVAPKLKKLWELIEENEPVSTYRNHDLRQSVLRMWRMSLFEQGHLESAAAINETMYELGYTTETGEEYRQRIIRDFDEYAHMRS